MITLRSRSGFVQQVTVGHYPSGEPLIKHPYLLDAQGDTHIERVMVQTTHVDELMNALFFVDFLRDRGNGPMELLLPYVPGARQDRSNPPDGDLLFTARSVAAAINARGFSRVVVFDPHSDVTPALIERCRALPAVAFVRPPAGKYQGVLSPDGGAEKRAFKVAQQLGVPMFHAWKRRDPGDGRLNGFGCEPINLPAGSRLLVVDDICDGGGTFLGLRSMVSEFDVDLFVTHGLFTQGSRKLTEVFHHVYCTDSMVDADREGVIEIKICDLILAQGVP